VRARRLTAARAPPPQAVPKLMDCMDNLEVSVDDLPLATCICKTLFNAQLGEDAVTIGVGRTVALHRRAPASHQNH
jgi:hypothetical protein